MVGIPVYIGRLGEGVDRVRDGGNLFRTPLSHVIIFHVSLMGAPPPRGGYHYLRVSWHVVPSRLPVAVLSRTSRQTSPTLRVTHSGPILCSAHGEVEFKGILVKVTQ